MPLRAVQQALTKQPFHPFRIRLSNGNVYEIRHPEFAALTRNSIFVGSPTDGGEAPDRMVECDLLHVVTIEPVNGE
jgi:hypothetical protein